MREWCNQLMMDFKGTSEDMAAMRARLGINDPMYDLALCELSHYKNENAALKQENERLKKITSCKYLHHFQEMGDGCCSACSWVQPSEF